MEDRVLEDERPYLRPLNESPRRASLLAIALVAVLGGIVYYHYHDSAEYDAQVPEAATSPAPRQPAPASEQPAIEHPLAAPPEAAALPSLENSDSLLRRALSELVGEKAFATFVHPVGLVRRIVAAVDNLPRRSAPARLFPVQRVAGAFAIVNASGGTAIDPGNFDRYQPHVAALEAIGSTALVHLYVAAYPLFQQAYEELGYPGRYFNDRLFVAIDDLLAAPEAGAAVQLIQPKVLYEFADPDLETRSAGQKIMIRMGPANATRVKAKLREIRDALSQASAGRR